MHAAMLYRVSRLPQIAALMPHAVAEIRSLILHGDIYASLALLDKHFPAVLDPPSFRFSDTLGETSISPRMGLPAYASSLDPAHLALNLQIQAFIESVRNSSHPGASDDSTPTSSRSGSASPTSASASTPPGERDGNGAEPAMEDEAGGRGEGVYGALHLVQSINARVQRLPEYWRSMYLKELEGVTALLAYGDLKHCPVRKYLDQHRRTALAEQINCAILVSCGRASQPLLEAAVRQTTFVWARMAEERIAVPANHPLLASTPARSHWLESGETTSSSQQYTPATSEDPRKLRGRVSPATLAADTSSPSDPSLLRSCRHGTCTRSSPSGSLGCAAQLRLLVPSDVLACEQSSPRAARSHPPARLSATCSLRLVHLHHAVFHRLPAHYSPHSPSAPLSSSRPRSTGCRRHPIHLLSYTTERGQR